MRVRRSDSLKNGILSTGLLLCAIVLMSIGPVVATETSAQLKTEDGFAAAGPILAQPQMPRTSVGAGLAAGPSQKTEERNINLDFHAADITDVLKALSIQAGTNVVVGPDVKGQVTITLSKVTLSEAMGYLANTCGLRFTVQNGTYVVNSGSSVGHNFGTDVVETVVVRYASAEELKSGIEATVPGVSVTVQAEKSADTKGAKTSGPTVLDATADPTKMSGETVSVASVSSPNQVTALLLSGPQESVDAAKQLIAKVEDCVRNEVVKQAGQRVSAAITLYSPIPEGVDKSISTQCGVTAAYIPAVKNKDTGTSTRAMMVVSGAPESVAAARLVLAKLDGAPVGLDGIPIGAGPGSDSETVTKVYRAKYTDAFDLGNTVAGAVPSVQVTYGPDTGFAVKNPDSGYFPSEVGKTEGYQMIRTKRGDNEKHADLVVLTGRPQDVDRAMELLESIDVKPQQILIEAKVLDLSNEASRDIGVDWSWDAFKSVGTTDITNTKTNPADSADARQVVRTLAIGPTQLVAKLNLAVTNGTARLLANPKVSAVSGKAADVFIGDEIKYVINIQNTPTGQNITTETAMVGIQLKAIGVVGPDNQITLQLHPEVSVISTFLKLDNGISLPQIARRFTDSTLRIKSGQTVVIGGLIKEQDIVNFSKVPFVGDLPFIGKLFQHKLKTKDRSEVTMLITATVLED